MKSAKALLFDYGATLDTEGRHWSHVLREGWEYAGINQVKDELFRAAYVMGERALAKAPIIEPTDNFHDLLVKKVRIEFYALDFYDAWPYPTDEIQSRALKVADYCNAYVLNHLKVARHILDILAKKYPLVLVSNFYGNLKEVLRAYQLNPFHAIIESACVHVRKPQPEIFKMAVAATGFSAAETIMIGDSYSKDILPAKNIGCQTIWLKGESWDDQVPDGEAADVTITSLEELLPLLLD